MAWVKNDDRMDDTRKVKRAWRRNRATIGLWEMAKTYSARHETDGLVPLEWVEDRLSDEAERAEVLQVMLDEELFEELAAGDQRTVKIPRVKKGKTVKISVTYGPVDEVSYIVHDYLEFNEARCEAEERRRADAERKTKDRRKPSEENPAGDTEESTARPDGQDAESGSLPFSFRKSRPVPTRPDPSRPDPSRPDPTRPDRLPPNPPTGGRKRDREVYEREFRAWVDAHPVTHELRAEWAGIETRLREIVDEPTFNMWLAPLHLHHADGDLLIAGTSPEGIGWIKTRFRDVLRAALEGRCMDIIACGCELAA
jgi:hypothetical protein